jgi:hypothetical protein
VNVWLEERRMKDVVYPHGLRETKAECYRVDFLYDLKGSGIARRELRGFTALELDVLCG